MELVVNNKTFSVGTVDLKRQWTVEPKYTVTTESGKRLREVRGVYKSYALTLRNINDDVYNDLINELTAKRDSHTITVPFGKTGTTTFEAFFDSISDELIKTVGEAHNWDNLTVNFSAAIPGGGV